MALLTSATPKLPMPLCRNACSNSGGLSSGWSLTLPSPLCFLKTLLLSVFSLHFSAPHWRSPPFSENSHVSRSNGQVSLFLTLPSRVLPPIRPASRCASICWKLSLRQLRPFALLITVLLCLPPGRSFGPVDLGAACGQGRRERAVMIPVLAIAEDLHEADASFDESPCNQAAGCVVLGDLFVDAIHAPNRFRLG